MRATAPALSETPLEEVPKSRDLPRLAAVSRRYLQHFPDALQPSVRLEALHSDRVTRFVLRGTVGPLRRDNSR